MTDIDADRKREIVVEYRQMAANTGNNQEAAKAIEAKYGVDKETLDRWNQEVPQAATSDGSATAPASEGDQDEA